MPLTTDELLRKTHSSRACEVHLVCLAVMNCNKLLLILAMVRNVFRCNKEEGPEQRKGEHIYLVKEEGYCHSENFLRRTSAGGGVCCLLSLKRRLKR